MKIELVPLIYSNKNDSNSRVVVDFCKDSKGGGSKSTDQPKAEDYPSNDIIKILLKHKYDFPFENIVKIYLQNI